MAWKVVAATVAGTAHGRVGQGGQDAYYHSLLGDGRLIAAVTDGAGSAALGGLGARTAGRFGIDALEGAIKNGASDSEAVKQAALAAVETIEKIAKAQSVQARDL